MGSRMKIEYTRALLNAALTGRLDDVSYETDPIFGLQVPSSCEGVPKKILKPRQTWADPSAYDEKAQHLAGLFKENFRQFESEIPETVLS